MNIPWSLIHIIHKKIDIFMYTILICNGPNNVTIKPIMQQDDLLYMYVHILLAPLLGYIVLFLILSRLIQIVYLLRVYE